MKYLIDTNICIYIINKKSKSVTDKLKELSFFDVAISSITIAELQYGVSKSKRKSFNQNLLSNFIKPFEILYFDENDSQTYGHIRAELEKKGEMIGAIDLFIAAQAISRSLTLVTNNEREFKRINNLKIENWAK